MTAYDCVSHEYLIYKLKRYGIIGPALNWVISFLSDKEQIVAITKNDKMYQSEKKKTTVWIPRESVMRPLFL